MSTRFTLKGWQVEFGWHGLRLTPPEQVDRYREITPAAWMQAADLFIPGGWWLAEATVRAQRETPVLRRRSRRRRLS